jgi:hypothetical protein
MSNTTRRRFLGATTLAALSASPLASSQEVPSKGSSGLSVILPRGRVPLSFIIDDSTCLVNMGKFCMPQFAATYPDRKDYQRPWREWPDEIPDSFVRRFGEWCAEHGVKGKYSIVPYPACVGWLDRTLPGWSQRELQLSLDLVRELMVPNWDIHPEMITHTRVIDIATGRPFQDFSPAHMENSFPQQDVSLDHLTAYLAYALRILKNCELPCEGITTPGGFGNRVKDKLPLAVFDAVRDVYGSELPHYFKYVSEGDQSTEPKLEAARVKDFEHPAFTVNVPAGTGDWFGGWDGAETSNGKKYCNSDATSGRMVELIEKNRPAVMLCHWPGLYCNGSLQGFRDFQKIVVALEKRFKDRTQWMKISEIARYWAAKEQTTFEGDDHSIKLTAPYACSNFTLRLDGQAPSKIVINVEDDSLELTPVSSLASLNEGKYFQEEKSVVICITLPRGSSELTLF